MPCALAMLTHRIFSLVFGASQVALVSSGHGAANSIPSSLEEILMWAKGSESLRAYAHGLDALLERRFEDASREVADMDAQNSFALKGVRESARAILGSGERVHSDVFMANFHA